MKKTTILFGAGADMLSSGANFALKVIGHNTKEMNTAIKEFYGTLPASDWYDSYVDNTIPLEKLVEASVYREYLSGKFPPTSQNKIKKEIKHINSTAPQTYKKDLIEKNTSYMGIIDSDFHTLIHPKILGKHTFWRVIDCYTRAYLCLVKDILNPTIDDKEFYLNALINPDDTHKGIVKTIRTDTKFQIEGYYRSLSKIANSHIRIVSTNYTPCCSVITGRNDIIHIHGRMDLFENPYEWKVITAEAAQKNNNLSSERKLLFPYMFIQSGTKPIIERTQIQEYSRMVDAFTQTEKIIIVGYNINYDDNHINSIIRSAIEDSKDVTILFFERDGTRSADPDGETRKKLRLNQVYSNLHVIRINSSNGLDAFEQQLKDTL